MTQVTAWLKLLYSFFHLFQLFVRAFKCLEIDGFLEESCVLSLWYLFFFSILFFIYNRWWLIAIDNFLFARTFVIFLWKRKFLWLFIFDLILIPVYCKVGKFLGKILFFKGKCFNFTKKLIRIVLFGIAKGIQVSICKVGLLLCRLKKNRPWPDPEFKN